MALLSSSSSCTHAVAPPVSPQQQQQDANRRLLKPVQFSRSCLGLASRCSVRQCSSTKSSFGGFHEQLLHLSTDPAAGCSSNARPRPTVCMTKPVIQFIKGTDEQTVPDVSLTKSRDGTNGTATFMFDQPSVFDSSRELGDITGLYMMDEEGVLQSVDVSAKFVNGKPAKIEARYIMRTPKEWDRFMRFMERYAEANGLGFVKK